MLILIAVFLGVIQGLTEFLPVSSSGHLAALQNLLFKDLLFFQKYSLSFDVALHFATLIVIIVFFRKQLLKLIISTRFIFRRTKSLEDKESFNKILFIIIGSIPTAIIGLVIKEFIEEVIFNRIIYIGLFLLVTGGLMLLPYLRKNQDPHRKLNLFDAIIIGVIQGFAVIPGISRSGSTISGGLLRGLDKTEAFEFSFLLSIPAIAGATLLTVLDINFQEITNEAILIFLTGMAAGVGAGFLGVSLLSKVVKKNKLNIFSYYCFGAGFLLIILSIVGL